MNNSINNQIISMFNDLNCNQKDILNILNSYDYKSKEFKQLLSTLEKQSVNFDISRIILIADWLYNNNKIGTHYKKALNWYQKALISPNAKVTYVLGECYQYGRGTKKDLIKAKEYYKMSADYIIQNNEGDINIINELCNFFNKDYSRIIKLYTISTNKGNPESAIKLAECYHNGWGVTQDLKKASELYKTACTLYNQI